MGKIPDDLRENIGRNIRACRMEKFPGRGGGLRCAEAFGVSPQQWSQWETGKRTPEELRLQQMADFFAVTVEWLRRDNRPPPSPPPEPPPIQPPPAHDDIMVESLRKLESFASRRSWTQDEPGSPASFFWLARHLILHLQRNGLRIDKQCLNYIAGLIQGLNKHG